MTFLLSLSTEKNLVHIEEKLPAINTTANPWRVVDVRPLLSRRYAMHENGVTCLVVTFLLSLNNEKNLVYIEEKLPGTSTTVNRSTKRHDSNWLLVTDHPLRGHVL